jgi:hypothetical protein
MNAPDGPPSYPWKTLAWQNQGTGQVSGCAHQGPYRGIHGGDNAYGDTTVG